MPIRAGELRERFIFEVREDLSDNSPPGDGYGNMEGDWLPQFTVWAKLHLMRGGENVIASRLQGRQPAILTVRASSLTRRITTDWRCRDKRTSEAYNIRSVELHPDRSGFDLLIERGVAT